MAVGDILQLRFYSHMDDQLAVNTVHYRIDAQGGAMRNPVEILAAKAQAASVKLKALMCNEASYRGYGASRVWPTIFREMFSAVDQGAGTGGAVALPTQVCGIITKYSDKFDDEPMRGRLYIPFPTEGYNDDETHRPTAGYQGFAIELANILFPSEAFEVAIGDGFTLSPVIYRRPQPDAEPPIAFDFGYITSTFCPLKWATQRKRGSYGRQNPTVP